MALAIRMQTRNNGLRNGIVKHETAIFVKKKGSVKYLIKSVDAVSMFVV
jgi:hypothetical protein